MVFYFSHRVNFVSGHALRVNSLLGAHFYSSVSSWAHFLNGDKQEG
jgi:hypothetical protein